MNGIPWSWGFSGLISIALGFGTSGKLEYAPVTMAHVRVFEPELAGLVGEGNDRSLTFRRLVQRIDESDGIVYVQSGACSVGAAAACLMLAVSEAGHARYLRIHVTGQLIRRERRIAIIGHELQHADEVLSRSWVRNTADAYALFIRIGSAGSIRSFETDDAQRVEAIIREELAARPSRHP
jgi:hypothetical protein